MSTLFSENLYMRIKNTFSGKLFGSFCIISALAFLLLLSGYQPAGAQAGAKVIELRIGNPEPTVHSSHIVLTAWAKKVEEQTKGQIHFTIFPGGQLAPSPEVYGAIVSGVMDVGRSAEGFTPQRFPLQVGSTFLIMGAPNAEIATRVRLDLNKKFPELRDEYKDIHLLFLYASPPATNLHTRFPVHTVKDLKGKQLRVPNTPAQIAWVKGWGAAPVTMAMDEAYLALNKGIVDGLFGSDEILKSFRLAEVTKYTTILNASSSPFYVAMNKQVWESLPPDVQKVIDGLSEWASIEMARTVDTVSAEADVFAKGLKHEFISPTPPALEEIRAPIRSGNEAWAKDMDAKGKPGTAILEEANASLKRYTAQPVVKPAAPAKAKTKR
jgi:TRAP-type C4-dicarboxylate transport system substrate-binding protein